MPNLIDNPMAPMEPPTYQALIAAAQFLWLIGITITVALRKPGEDAGKAVHDLTAQLTALATRNAAAIAEIKAKGDLTDERVKHLPTHNDMHNLMREVSAMKGQLQTVIDGQDRWQRATERIEDWLNTNRGGK